MKNFAIYGALFITLIIGNGCVSKPHRPDAPLCGYGGDCIDARGEHREDPRLLLCTTPLGYSAYEDYIDRLELRIRELERRCQ